MLSSLALSLVLAGSAHAQDAPTPPSRNHVALVVGLSSYQNLPDVVELDFARSDAALVARALEESAHFDEVFLLADREATRERIRSTMREEIAQLVGPDDVFVLYFTGHGIGADLGLPTLLAFDSTLENGQEDGLLLDSLKVDLQTWTPAGTTLVVTDAIHRNQLDGIYFFGPAANEWPALSPGTMILSSSASQTPAEDGAFGKVFANGISGGADADGDTRVTAEELFTFLHGVLSPGGQVPVSAGSFDPTMVLARGVDASAVPPLGATAEEAPEDVYPDVVLDKAKFVFTEGAAQQVQCRDKPLEVCAPSCYVWEVQAGPCDVSAVIDGIPMQGRLRLEERGRYICERQGPDLVCVGPG